MYTDWQHVMLYNNTLASETVIFRAVERKKAHKHLWVSLLIASRLLKSLSLAFVSAAHVNDLFHVH